ncbi:Protein SET DOMAIN GROUP 41 [Bienertia sinuspersici]
MVKGLELVFIISASLGLIIVAPLILVFVLFRLLGFLRLLMGVHQCGFCLLAMILLLKGMTEVIILLVNWVEVGFKSWGAVNYGPRIIVRSIKEIERGEEVTITYIDLLQPTEMFWVDLRKGCSKTLDKHNKELAFENLRVMLDSTIAEYMEDGNPVPCCEKVERLLSDGEFDQTNEASDIQIKLSPLHTLSLNAYTTLVSTYKIRAAMRTDEMQFQNIEMRTSAAYSLLLAGATNHLFLSEPSLVASAATFWMDAGQSLLQFGGSLSCSLFAKAELPKLSVIMDVNCPKCSLLDKFKLVTASSQSQDKLCNDMSNEFHRCVSAIIPKIWSFLSQGCKYLKHVKDPIDFSWIQAMKSLDNAPSLHDDFSLFNGCDNEDHELIHVKAYISRLGSHCYLYGGYLSSICYGHSCSSVLIRNVIHI